MIQTVLGEIKQEDICNVLPHEHFLFGQVGVKGDKNNPYCKERAYRNSLSMLKLISQYNVNLIIDVTTIERGRDVELLKQVSQDTNIHIVCATGLFKDEDNYLSYFKSISYSENIVTYIADVFMKEISIGIGNTGVKAGVIKVASSLQIISPMEKIIFEAASIAQKATNVPILTHCEKGTMGLEQANYLISLGVSPKKIIIGHMTSNTNMMEMKQILATGVYIAFDQFGIVSIPGIPSDEQKMNTLMNLLLDGYGDSIVLSHDCIFDRLGMISKSKPRFPNFIFEHVIPFLKQNNISDDQICKLIRNNLLSIFDIE